MKSHLSSPMPPCASTTIPRRYGPLPASKLGNYPRSPFYAQMFSDAGFPEAANGTWSDAMLEAVVLSGDEARVEERLREWLSFGATELLVSPVLAGPDREASLQRTLKLLAKLAQSV